MRTRPEALISVRGRTPTQPCEFSCGRWSYSCAKMFAYLTALGKNELQRELRRRRAELRTAVEHGGNRQSAHAHDADDDDRRRGVESTLAPAPAVLHNTSRSLRQRRRAVVSENLPPPPPPPRVIRRRRINSPGKLGRRVDWRRGWSGWRAARPRRLAVGTW